MVRMENFNYLHIYLLVLSLIGVLFSVVLNIYDLNHINIMNVVVQADNDMFSSDRDSMSSQEH